MNIIFTNESVTGYTKSWSRWVESHVCCFIFIALHTAQSWDRPTWDMISSNVRYFFNFLHEIPNCVISTCREDLPFVGLPTQHDSFPQWGYWWSSQCPESHVYSYIAYEDQRNIFTVHDLIDKRVISLALRLEVKLKYCHSLLQGHGWPCSSVITNGASSYTCLG